MRTRRFSTRPPNMCVSSFIRDTTEPPPTSENFREVDAKFFGISWMVGRFKPYVLEVVA